MTKEELIACETENEVILKLSGEEEIKKLSLSNDLGDMLMQ